MEAGQEIFGKAIYTYTRKQAIADGYQIKLEGTHAEIARQAGWKYPVYLTSGVWALIEEAVENGRDDIDTVLWDIVWMARFGQDLSEDTRVFKVVTLLGTGRDQEHTLYIQVGATDFDDPEPSITIMLPSEQ